MSDSFILLLGVLAAALRTRRDLVALRQRVASSVGEHEAAIFDAHLLLLEDDELVGCQRALPHSHESPAS